MTRVRCDGLAVMRTRDDTVARLSMGSIQQNVATERLGASKSAQDHLFLGAPEPPIRNAHQLRRDDEAQTPKQENSSPQVRACLKIGLLIFRPERPAIL